MFGVLSSVMDRFIIKYNGYRYLIKKTFCVLAVCLATTVTLVPLFGITGAAISVVMTEFMAFTVLNYFFRGQPMMNIHKIFIQPGKLWLLINRTLFSGR
ncbi:flippase, partial [Pantoea ananatis]